MSDVAHQQEPGESGASHAEDPQKGTRRTTVILLLIILLLLIWYLVGDRLTPYTTAARVQAFVVAVVPDVSGYVAEIPIKKNQLVAAGDTLVQIEKKRFEIAVESAEAALELAGQDMGADTAAVATAAATLSSAEAQLDEAKAQGARIFQLEEKGLVAKAKGDVARKEIKTGQAQVDAAQSELERAKQLLGDADTADNPRMRAALAALEEARLNLERTTIRAPGQGFVGGLKIDEGTYASAGQAAMTFVAVDDIWVEASMTENQLGNLEPGDKVELAFDVLPGKVFEGKVKSSAVGVSTGKKIDLGDLSTAQKATGWLRDPQRFPVIIQLTNYDIDVQRTGGIRVNSQADIIVYTGDNPFWNTLGKGWIRLVSWLSYAF
jgi:multidrug resistance efflux pump